MVDTAPKKSKLAATLIKAVGQQARSLSSVQDEANAAVQDGLRRQDLNLLASLGAQGRHKQNIERDLHRRHEKHHLVPIYEVQIPYHDAAGKVKNTTAAMVLPHEWFGAMMTAEKDYMLKLLGGGPTETQQWWDLAEESCPQWWSSHPMRSKILQHKSLYIPIRLWGDDAPMGKKGKRSVLAVAWTGCFGSGEATERHFLICAGEAKKVTAEAEDKLWEIITWSMYHAAMGYYPTLDPNGAEWMCPRRKKWAGQRLSPQGHCAVVCQVGGDWKYLHQICRLPWTQATEETCRFYRCTKSAGAMNYADPRENAPWVNTMRAPTEYLSLVTRDFTIAPPPVTSLMGFCTDMVVDDAMHDDLLGVRLNLCGSALVWLAEQKFRLPDAPDKGRLPQLDEQLAEAYHSMLKFCRRNALKHSLLKFNHNSVGQREANSWAELNKGAGAANTAILSLWLADAVRPHSTRGQQWQLLSTTLYGFASIYILLTKPVVRFNDDEVERLRVSRRYALEGYHELSRQAAADGKWQFYMQPKFHKFDVCLREAIRTHLNPGSYWNFGSESWLGMISRLAQSAHPRTLQIRVVQRWLLSFHFGDANEA